MLPMTEAESPLAFLGEPLTAEKGVLDRIRFGPRAMVRPLGKELISILYPRDRCPKTRLDKRFSVMNNEVQASPRVNFRLGCSHLDGLRANICGEN